LDDQHPATPQVGVIGAHNNEEMVPAYIKYQEHQIIAAARKQVLDSLPDGNNEVSIAIINDEFSKKQQASAAMLLNTVAFLRDGILASGIPFDGKLRISSIKVADDGGSTLVILSGIPLGHENKPLQSTPIELAVTNETYILYAQ